jgi:hypothetical protein
LASRKRAISNLLVAFFTLMLITLQLRQNHIERMLSQYFDLSIANAGIAFKSVPTDPLPGEPLMLTNEECLLFR